MYIIIFQRILKLFILNILADSNTKIIRAINIGKIKRKIEPQTL